MISLFKKRTALNTTNHKNSTLTISKDISENLDFINKTFINCDDLIIKLFTIHNFNTKAALIYIDGLSNSDLINDHIISPMENIDNTYTTSELSPKMLKNNILTTISSDELSDFNQIIKKITDGNVVLLIDYSPYALIIYAGMKLGRQSGEPSTEQTIKSPRESFVENIKNNLVLIRKRIKNPNLAVEHINFGEQTNQSLGLIYIKELINPEMLNIIKKSLNKICVDGFTSSGQLISSIEQHKWTIFPQVFSTERPDRAVSLLLEGRAVILLDGSPFALIAPSTFSLYFKSSDDYSGRTIIASLIKFLRYAAFFESVSFSGLFIALTSYHQGLFPLELLLSIASTRAGLPFPIIIEVLFMEFTLYLLQEAAIRLPKPLSQTIGIVGGLVIGQSVVTAGIISPIVVIIVAISAISSFTLPDYEFSLSTIIMRLLIIIASSILGLYGLIIAWLLLILHASSLESFGIKYLEDFFPLNSEKLEDSFLKLPEYKSQKRPSYLLQKNIIKKHFTKGTGEKYE